MTQTESEFRLKIGIIGGTGLDRDSSIIKDLKLVSVPTTPYGDPSDNEVITGTIEGVDIVLMGRHGSKHNINPSDVNYRANLWTLKELGVTIVLVTTACGSLKLEVSPGDFAILDQYIDRTCLRGRTFHKVSHIPQGKPFHPKLQQILEESIAQLGYKFHPKVTTVTIEGPRFSTLAESRLYKSWGADIVNMTTVPEAQLAAELGLIYGALALVTDYDCWHESDDESVSVDLVMNRLKELSERAKNVLSLTIKNISQNDWQTIWHKKQSDSKLAVMYH
ncbi:S-methyl-5'-thioadenosine phosphorylase-like [Oppia nitens]|uniref:S-methyl-5'-thioadenosine phosphorylase-like n=1 Tax=Oppia nitens TaxID=1686743 RepID=UPI0023DBF70B|nr:S-methyl-5'-thioadenosine phosphorylase-like [Oppia nitens]